MKKISILSLLVLAILAATFGGARVTKGYVFSYYEFERPMSDRMTDEEWRAIVYDPDRADELEKYRPGWYGEFKKNTQ